MDLKSKIILISGPTASGKSNFSIKLAKKINGEIINADSMQVYKNFPILTSQPNLEDLREVRHHLYGYVENTKSYNAMNWMIEAKRVINKLHNQNKVAILVGGSGLYLEFLYKGVNNIPIISIEVKNKVKKMFSDNSLNELYTFALKIDYDYTSKVDKADIFRIH